MAPNERKTAEGVFVVDIEHDAEIVEDDEPTEEELRASIRRSMQQALAGKTHPAEEALKEIRRELAADADACQNN